MSECVFCKIVSGEIPCEKVYEDDEILAFNDINPQTPVHIVIIPKKHVEDISVLGEKDDGLAGKILRIAANTAKEKRLGGGYRILTNCGADAGQTVFHLHFHLLGGRKMSVEMA
jgi:histidine triad (HIT) family protein